MAPRAERQDSAMVMEVSVVLMDLSPVVIAVVIAVVFLVTSSTSIVPARSNATSIALFLHCCTTVTGGGSSSCPLVLWCVPLQADQCELATSVRSLVLRVCPGRLESRGMVNSMQVFEDGGCDRGVDELVALSMIWSDRVAAPDTMVRPPRPKEHLRSQRN